MCEIKRVLLHLALPFFHIYKGKEREREKDPLGFSHYVNHLGFTTIQDICLCLGPKVGFSEEGLSESAGKELDQTIGWLAIVRVSLGVRRELDFLYSAPPYCSV